MARKYTLKGGGNFGFDATSLKFGAGCDNPTDLDDLTIITNCDKKKQSGRVDQAKRCLMFEFDKVSEFKALFKVNVTQGSSPYGRNFAISGKSDFFTDANSTACTIS